MWTAKLTTLSLTPSTSRYPKVMTEEGVRAVREWLGSTNQLEEGRGAMNNVVRVAVGSECVCFRIALY